jgi:hypothetical protein
MVISPVLAYLFFKDALPVITETGNADVGKWVAYHLH